MASTILYRSSQLPQVAAFEESTQIGQRFVQVPAVAAQLLACEPSLVDVLASGPGYVAYSIFDSEGPLNYAAMAALTEISGVAFSDEENEQLRRVVLIMHQ